MAADTSVINISDVVSSAYDTTARGRDDPCLRWGIPGARGGNIPTLPRHADRVGPQVNVGFNVATDTDRSSSQYSVGVAVAALKERLDFDVAFLGRSEIDRAVTQRSVSGPHQTAAGPALRPYFGAEFDRKDFFDLSFGGRLRIYKTLVGTAGFMSARSTTTVSGRPP